MSCYIVERDHIAQLIDAALSFGDGRGFSWYANGLYRTLRSGSPEDAKVLGQELWDENAKSFRCRYEGRYSEETDNLDYGEHEPSGEPGTFLISTGMTPVCSTTFDPVAVLKSIACLEYQCCEHPEWPESTAYRFLYALERAAINRLDGFKEANWGKPAP